MSSRAEGAKKEAHKKTEKIGYDPVGLRRCMERELDPRRYEHTLGVAYTAAALAMRYGADMKKAQIAGLLHDCAKNLSSEKQIRTCHKHSIAINAAEQKNPSLLHAKVGSFLAWHKYGIEDREILDAITWQNGHNVDYIEPGRNQAPNLPQARKLAFEDLDECLFLILRDTLAYLTASKAEVDPMTQQTYEYYRAEREKGGRQ